MQQVQGDMEKRSLNEKPILRLELSNNSSVGMIPCNYKFFHCFEFFFDDRLFGSMQVWSIDTCQVHNIATIRQQISVFGTS